MSPRTKSRDSNIQRSREERGNQKRRLRGNKQYHGEEKESAVLKARGRDAASGREHSNAAMLLTDQAEQGLGTGFHPLEISDDPEERSSEDMLGAAVSLPMLPAIVKQ